MGRTVKSVFGKIRDSVISKTIIACDSAAEQIKDEISQRASLDPNETSYIGYEGYDNEIQFALYKGSFKTEEAKREGNIIKGKVLNDYLVYFAKYKEMIPFGCFIEYGTGRNASGVYPITDQPWDQRTRHQAIDTGARIFYINEKPIFIGGTYGMSPQPHWQPVIDLRAKKIMVEKLKENL